MTFHLCNKVQYNTIILYAQKLVGSQLSLLYTWAKQKINKQQLKIKTRLAQEIHK